MNKKIETTLYIGGSVLAAGVIVVIIAGIVSCIPPEPEQETITVTSKEKEEDGIYCYGVEVYRRCKSLFKYFVNGQDTGERVFSSVEVGKTYVCKKSTSEGWRWCEEEK